MMRFLYEYFSTHSLKWFTRAARQFARAATGVFAGLQRTGSVGAAKPLLEPGDASPFGLQAAAR